jgi:hypothetical protein
MAEKVIVKETKNNVIISSPGPQGPRGRTILNGSGAPANNLGLAGDFYYNIANSDFYGPKISDTTWVGVTVIPLYATPENFTTSWELAQLVQGVDMLYRLEIDHNLGFSPNVTVVSSAGEVLETGVDYNSLNKLTLIMAQPFSGTANLS